MVVFAAAPMPFLRFCCCFVLLLLLLLQIAAAAEAGADGVYLMYSVCGGVLEDLLFAACTCGIEAAVEVNSAAEAAAAAAAGATLLVVSSKCMHAAAAPLFISF